MLRKGGGDQARCTIVAADDDASATERFLCVATACAAAEAVRDEGGHALLISDELDGLCEVWDLAGDAVASAGGPRGEAADRLHSSEQRIFYASYLQRASQLTEAKGAGSLSLLALVTKHVDPAVMAATAAPPTGAAAAQAPRLSAPRGADSPGRAVA